jgi:N-acetylglucosamine malate deacetylase 1
VKHIVVLSPHPDDETLGCGGVLLGAHGTDKVHVIHLTSGELTTGYGVDAPEAASIRESEAQRVATMLCISSTEFWREPDGRLQATAALVEKLARRLTELKPDVLYVPHSQEQHRDHRAVFRLARSAIARLDAADATLALTYEVWTPLRHPRYVVDISSHAQSKLQALSAYESQCSYLRYDLGMLGLNQYRGEMIAASHGKRFAYAECFGLLQSTSPITSALDAQAFSHECGP